MSVLHYFREGDLSFDYSDSWIKYGGAELKKWDASMIPYDKFPELIKYREKRKWSVLSDFIRLWAIYEEGGIYLDCDVELIKDITLFYDYSSFICMEGEPVYVNAAVTGGHKGSIHHLNMLDGFFDVLAGRKSYQCPFEVACGVWSHTDYVNGLLGRKLVSEDLSNTFLLNDLFVLPKRVFYPFNWNEQYSDDCITDQTYGIHWWKKSWA